MMLSKLFSQLEKDMGITCDAKRCTAQAAFIVRVHQIDHCKDTECGSQGTRDYLRCGRCAVKLRSDVHNILTKLPQNLISVRCTSCLRQFGTLEDICKFEPLIHVNA